MIADFHFLRPWWLLMILPLFGLIWILWQQKPKLHAWSEVCDSHLLNHLLQKKDLVNDWGLCSVCLLVSCL